VTKSHFSLENVVAETNVKKASETGSGKTAAFLIQLLIVA
jgi:superfamily II DNA/RNA helicase